MRYLVTGGCGFIGSHTAAALLSNGHEVCILDNLSSGKIQNKPVNAELIIGEVADSEAVAKAMTGCDGVFHFAAIASVERCNRDWIGAHRTNLGGTVTVFEAACRARLNGPVPVVYASSAAVYGRSTEVPLRETSRLRPESPYGADKLGCELHAAAGFRVHGLPTCGVRFFNVYGPGQDPHSPYSGVISIFCDRARNGREITIFGDGRQTRDFVFVDDAVAGVLAAMDGCLHAATVVNICTGRGTSLLDLVGYIEQNLHSQTPLSFAERRRGDIDLSVGDPSLGAEQLGFRAPTSIRTGLARLLYGERSEASQKRLVAQDMRSAVQGPPGLKEVRNATGAG
jgi:UDP-glucose 4-epimerase